MQKVFAERLKRVLPNLIHENQSGYVPGRSICENIRSILDIMEYTKDNNETGILFFIDFEKAFDSLEWDFLNKCLELFNFGPEFIRWVNIFYKNIQSCVINNGVCCTLLFLFLHTLYFLFLAATTLIQSVESDKETRFLLTCL